MAKSDLENEIIRLQNLKHTKELPLEELERMAFVNLEAKKFEKSHEFLNKDEAKDAKSLYLLYLENYEFDNMSDLSTLGDLVLNEVQKKRIDRSVIEYYNKNKENPTYVPDKLLKARQDLENHILSLKIKLGIDKEGDDKKDELTANQTLIKRFDKYIETHKNEFQTVCSRCGNILNLRQRVKNFDTLQHPWFAGRWLFNYEILLDVKNGKLSKEDAWRYIRCAGQGGEYKPSSSKEYCIDYINYCLKNWNEITSHLNLEQGGK